MEQERVRQGAPRNTGDGVVTCSEPSIAGATPYYDAILRSKLMEKERVRQGKASDRDEAVVAYGDSRKSML